MLDILQYPYYFKNNLIMLLKFDYVYVHSTTIRFKLSCLVLWNLSVINDSYKDCPEWVAFTTRHSPKASGYIVSHEPGWNLGDRAEDRGPSIEPWAPLTLRFGKMLRVRQADWEEPAPFRTWRKARVLVWTLVRAHSSQNCGFVSNLPLELWKAHTLSLLCQTLTWRL